MEKANRYGNGYWWNYFIQMGKIDKNSREKAAVFDLPEKEECDNIIITVQVARQRFCCNFQYRYNRKKKEKRNVYNF